MSDRVKTLVVEWGMSSEIEVTAVRAARLAFKVASGAEDHLGWVKLSPDGAIYATDGKAFVRARAAHNADLAEPLYVRLVGNPSFSRTAEGFTLDLDLMVLTEHRPRSEAQYNLEARTAVRFPLVENLNPGRLSSPTAAPLFDSIRGGRIASDYGMELGVWGPSLVPDTVELLNTDDGDLVLLAGVRMEGENG